MRPTAPLVNSHNLHVMKITFRSQFLRVLKPYILTVINGWYLKLNLHLLVPANYLEISVNDPVTHGEGRTRFTDFRMEMKTNMPVFKVTFKPCAQANWFFVVNSWEKCLYGGAILSSNGWEMRWVPFSHTHMHAGKYTRTKTQTPPQKHVHREDVCARKQSIPLILVFKPIPLTQVTRTVQINVPSLPGKAITKQLPFLKNDDGKIWFSSFQI